MTNKLEQEFRAALVNYIKAPENLDYQMALIKSAHSICNTAMETIGIDPGEYWVRIDDDLSAALKDIKTHPKNEKILRDFIELLGTSESEHAYQAIITLKLALYKHLIPNFIDLESVANEKLGMLDKVIEVLRGQNYVYLNELIKVRSEIRRTIDDHLQLPPEHRLGKKLEFESKLYQIYNSQKKSIEADILAKTVIYNLIGALAGLVIIYGLYLVATYQERGTFFYRPEEQPLSQFNSIMENFCDTPSLLVTSVPHDLGKEPSKHGE